MNLEVISIANFDVDDKDRRKNEPTVNTNSYEEEASNCDNNLHFEFIDLRENGVKVKPRKWRVIKSYAFKRDFERNSSFLRDDEEELDEGLERLNKLKLLFKKMIPT